MTTTHGLQPPSDFLDQAKLILATGGWTSAAIRFDGIEYILDGFVASFEEKCTLEEQLRGLFGGSVVNRLRIHPAQTS